MKSAPFVEPYVNFFEFVTNWGFFAPDPGPPPIFIEYELEDETGQTFSSGRWPSYPNPFFLSERQNRRAALVRFMTLDDSRPEKMLAPYLCDQNPHATSVSLWRAFYNLPSMLDAAHGTPVVPLNGPPVRQWLSHSFCKEYKS